MTQELFREDGYLRTCEALVTESDAQGVCLDRTVFYPLGGGQPGDCGWLATADGRRIPVIDTRKNAETGELVHVLAEGIFPPRPGEKLLAEIDWARRHRHMRMHTCLHLLCSLVPGGVTGGSVGDGKGRLDFDLQGETLDKEALEHDLNRLIAEDRPVEARWIADEELATRPELVRTMSVKPPTGHGRVRLVAIEGADLQPCGGTHVKRTGEIGAVKVVKIESKGKRNRRVNLAFGE